MEHELLHTIEEWVNKSIHPFALQNSIDARQRLDWLLLVDHQVNQLCHAISEAGHTADSQQYIYSIQLGVLRMLERLGIYIHENAAPVAFDLPAFYLAVASSLESVLEYIRRYFPQHFQHNFQVPYSTWLKCHGQLSTQLAKLETAYQHPGIEQPLLRVALQPIRDFVSAQVASITYRQLHYLQAMARELSFLYDNSNPEAVKDINWEIHTVLLQLNYNLPRYVLLCTSRLDEKMQGKTDEEMLATLQWYFRTMEQLGPLPNFCYIPTLPSVTEQITASLRHAYKLLIDKSASLAALSQGPPAYQRRIHLSVSVPVLTLFIKLCLNAGIITNQSKAEVFRIISQVFATPKSADLSPQSVKAKYKDTSLHAIRVTRELLHKLLELLKHE
ncbi:hypothetical protein [Chitinophaga sp. S165]|uniref:hypothetical protein n=1 Tax=Chitinophaga sp. S165 TaxID=2135462 RepID=UPI000D7155A7|nr:hypothetical protein [Chitinophaga sp. S165]PWV47120.1 hypothetical protein C7475_109208 [Chitinophaga sp. S165]